MFIVARKIVVFIIATLMLYTKSLSEYIWLILALLFIDDVLVNKWIDKLRR